MADQKKKIAFYLENHNIADVDFSTPEMGNPGCGGTEYLFAATPHYLNKLAGTNYQPVLLANVTDKLPKNIQSHKVASVYEAAKKASSLGVDIFIYRPHRNTDPQLLNLIEDLKLPTIGWAHISPKANHMRAMAKTDHFKALICVEHEQHDQAQDTLLATKQKLSFIVNGFDVDQFRLSSPPEKDNKLVVYLGALVPKKGFHVLAQIWPKILARIPDAKLTVIGTGALYDHNAELGPWGIADKDYEENNIIPYLSDENGAPHPSVTFAGRLGEEKKEILHKALIGVPNPTGVTENCPGSALEFQACGTAVVSGAFWGMLDTIKHDVGGLLGKTNQDLENHIINLLENPEHANQLGTQGIAFVRDKYNWPKVISEWKGLFDAITNGNSIPRKPFKSNFTDHHKWLIWLNSLLQKTIGRIICWPSVSELKTRIYRKFYA